MICVACNKDKHRSEFNKYKNKRSTPAETCLECRQKPCACGCEQLTSGYYSHSGGPSIFVYGHHNRMPRQRALVRERIRHAAEKGSYRKSEEWRKDAAEKKRGQRNPMFGKSEEMKKIAMGRIGSLNGHFGKPAAHGKGQWFVDRQNRRMFLKSTWELRFAEWLDELGLTWEYEPRRFVLGDATYTPDFWIVEWDCFWEIKGWFHERHKNNVQKFREQYAGTKLVVATRAVMQLIFGDKFQ